MNNNKTLIKNVVFLCSLVSIFFIIINMMIAFEERYMVIEEVGQQVENRAIYELLDAKIEQEGKNENEKKVEIIVDDKLDGIITKKVSIGYTLKEANVVLGMDEKVIATIEKIVDDNIRIVIASKKIIEDKKYLSFDVEESWSDKLFKGEVRILKKGEKGIEKNVYEVSLENDKEKTRKLIKTELVKEPINQVIALGTREIVSRGGEEFDFEKYIKMTATGYTHTGNKTYTGIWPSTGIVAVDPKVIKLGTRLYIDGYGYATAMDVGSSIKGNRVDLFFETREEALNWGRRSVEVFVLKNN
ncbi:MAG: 3D domain-containing protein [Clostridia bacterium]|nr:3D domain-containing protein [Clostridia bacterium]